MHGHLNAKYVFISCHCPEPHTRHLDSPPLTQSLYVPSYRHPTYSIHTLLSRGNNPEFRLFPQSETRLLSARAMYSRTVASLQIYLICTALLVRFSGPQPLPNNTFRAWVETLPYPANELWLKFLENGNFNFFTKFSTDKCRRFWAEARH